MKKIVTTAEMRQIENEANRAGLDDFTLMQAAGTAAAQFITAHTKIPGKFCLVVAGKGNNGGDAFVVGQKLHESGGRVVVLLADELPQSAAAKEAFHLLLATGVEILTYDPADEKQRQYFFKADLVVDGVFGTGFRGEIPPAITPLFSAINHTPAGVFSLDVPSGIDADSGFVAQGAVKADFTLTFHGQKAGTLFYPTKKYTGHVEVLPIGIPGQEGHAGFLTEYEDVFAVLTPRRADSHKGDYGHLLSICGREGFIGAAVLSALGASRVGTGLLTAAVPVPALIPIHTKLPEAMTITLPAGADGGYTEKNDEKVLSALAKKTACLIGCGLGQNSATTGLIEKLVQTADIPLVIDADGINNLTKRIDIIKQAKTPVILTPHMGEMARLLKMPVGTLRQNRIPILQNFAKEYRAVVVLKDSVSAIFSPDGYYWVNQTGNAGLAKGGSGDVLAGMIAGLCAQGIDPVKSAVCAVYLHGLAADLCAKRLSAYAMQPSDILTDLGELFAKQGL